ncbi:MAG: MBL fold metallo-hydrolase [Nannocystaceae bacterium]|nr:MBL fold metallo-hydrolase [Deltaproteobacteria bacterium]MBP7285456.1 MBL fold metallo-hydrolase [Nannocystaceae bacterium]
MRRTIASVSLFMAVLACGGAPTVVGAGSSSSGAATTASSSSGAGTAGETSSVGGGSTGVGTAGSSGGGSGSSTAGGSSSGDVRSCTGVFPEHWIDGLDCAEPQIMVHAYDDDTVILRQSLCTSFEGPFLYLLFGGERALLLDTGAGGIPVAQTVGGVIEQWLAERGRSSIELVVVNTHAHGDHVAGNPMFEGLPGVTVVTPSVAGVSSYFGIDDWPDQVVPFDLGGRVVDIVPIPGHQASHLAFFDHGAGLLLTGDTLYPGRLYIEDFAAYRESLARLVANVDPAQVCHVLGTHIEMTNSPGVDFEFGADQHPDEHVLELGWDHLVELKSAVDAMGSPHIEIHDDFIVYPL